MIEKFKQSSNAPGSPEGEMEKISLSNAMSRAETQQDLMGVILADEEYGEEMARMGIDPDELSELMFRAGNMVSEKGGVARQELAEKFPEISPHFERVFQADFAAYGPGQGLTAENTPEEPVASTENQIESGSEEPENKPWYWNMDWSHESHELSPRTHEILSEHGRAGDQMQTAYYINSGLAEHEFNRIQAGQESGKPYEEFNDVPHQLDGIADYVESLAGKDGEYLIETGDGRIESRHAVNYARSIRKAGLYIPGYNDLPIAAAVQEATSDMRAAIREKLATAQTKEDLLAVLDEYEAAGLKTAVLNDNYLEGRMLLATHTEQINGHDLDDLRASIEEKKPRGVGFEGAWADAVQRVRESGGFSQ